MGAHFNKLKTAGEGGVNNHFNRPVAPSMAPGAPQEVPLGCRREERGLVVQMNDEQRSMAPLKVQPEGPVRIVHPAALSLAYVGQPHCTRSALLDEQCALAGRLK